MREWINIVNDGLIKVPPQMSREIRMAVLREILAHMQTQPALVKICHELAERYDLSIPPKAMPYVRFHVESESLYGMQPMRDTLLVWINWTDSACGYVISEHAIMIGLRRDDLTQAYEAGDPQALFLAIREVWSAIEHELRHYVQYSVLQDPRQEKSHAAYKAHGDDYLTSPVEHDPMLGTMVDELFTILDTHADVAEVFAKFGIRPIIQSYIELSPVFAAYRSRSGGPKYKRALKKFTQAVLQRLDGNASA
jgi:hypothetical protein